MNLLEDALKHGVKKFIYVSVLHGEKLKHLKICEAKEAFVERLKSAGIDYCVIRPNGFFSDLSAFFDMAKNGRAYLLGNGEKKLNPIHGADLAEICVDAIKNPQETLRWAALKYFRKTTLPGWLSRFWARRQKSRIFRLGEEVSAGGTKSFYWREGLWACRIFSHRDGDGHDRARIRKTPSESLLSRVASRC